MRNPNQNKQLNQHKDDLVPPLKYPPKNIMALMEQIRRGRTGRLHEGVDNLRPNQYPCNSDMMGHMNRWPIGASHSRTAQDHFNVNMTGAGYVRVCPKFGTMRGSENMGLNCKRKYFGDRYQSGRAEEIQGNARELINCRKSYKDDGENHRDYLNDGTGRRENYIQDKRFMCAREKQQANGRRILVDLNMDRGFLGMNWKGGEEYCMDYVEDRNRRKNYDAERGSFGAITKDRKRRDDMGELVGHSKSVIEEGTRAKKGHDASNRKGAGSGDNNSKKWRGLLSAPPKSGSHQRRQKKKAGK